VGVAALAIALVAKAPKHQSAKFVFATFNDGTGDPGWSVRASPEYVAICGVLLSQYTITGFDASAHLSEETHNAARNAPIGVLTSIGVSAIFGFFLMLCLLFSIQDFAATVGTSYGYPVVQVFVDVFGTKGAMAAMTLVIICVWHCGLFSLTSNSRMMFAFSRDGALPAFFDAVDAKHHSPVRTICLAALLAFILALPSLGSAVAFSAATSIATIGLYISYATPILIAVIWPQHFVHGPFYLGKFSRPIGIVACTWVCLNHNYFCHMLIRLATGRIHHCYFLLANCKPSDISNRQLHTSGSRNCCYIYHCQLGSLGAPMVHRPKEAN
jgi:amino acid transporter